MCEKMLFTHFILGKHYTAKIYLLKLASLFQNQMSV